MGFFSSLVHLNWSSFNPFDVLKGCANAFLVDFQNESTKKIVEEIVKYRLPICNNCHMNDNNFCQNNGTKTINHVITGKAVKGCGCNLTCGTALLSKNCPAGKWNAYVP